MNRLRDKQEIWIYLELMCKHPWVICRILLKDSSSRTRDIMDILFSVMKWGKEQTDRHTKSLKLFETNIQTSPECLQKIWERLLIQNWRYHWYPNIRKDMRQWTDWPTYKKSEIIWNHCTKIPGMFPVNLRKIAHPELEISLIP